MALSLHSLSICREVIRVVPHYDDRVPHGPHDFSVFRVDPFLCVRVHCSFHYVRYVCRCPFYFTNIMALPLLP